MDILPIRLKCLASFKKLIDSENTPKINAITDITGNLFHHLDMEQKQSLIANIIATTSSAQLLMEWNELFSKDYMFHDMPQDIMSMVLSYSSIETILVNCYGVSHAMKKLILNKRIILFKNRIRITAHMRNETEIKDDTVYINHKYIPRFISFCLCTGFKSFSMDQKIRYVFF